jgi:hypothetical protein
VRWQTLFSSLASVLLIASCGGTPPNAVPVSPSEAGGEVLVPVGPMGLSESGAPGQVGQGAGPSGESTDGGAADESEIAPDTGASGRDSAPASDGEAVVRGDADLTPTGDADSEGAATREGGAPIFDATVPLDAQTPVADAALSLDGSASSGSIDPQLRCGARTCLLPAEQCCVYESPTGGPSQYACTTSANCPNRPPSQNSVALQCEAAANCPAGTRCCIIDSQGNLHSRCQDGCPAPNAATLCDRSAIPTGCPGNAPCSTNNSESWSLNSNFATCGGIIHY